MLNVSVHRCEHWDVNNENLHGQFYEEHTGDQQITQEMFSLIRQVDPKPTLFINDYNVLAEIQTATVSSNYVVLRDWNTNRYSKLLCRFEMREMNLVDTSI